MAQALAALPIAFREWSPIAVTAAAYRRMRSAVFGESQVQEDGWLPGIGGDGARPPEIDLQSRWFAGEFGGAFHSVSGQQVEIVQFGTWNHSAGPDFSEVAVRLGGRLLTGSLELDWDVRDWERHGHAENPAYDGVVLHVFFEQPAGTDCFTRTSAHREVPQVRIDLAAYPDAGPSPPPAEAKCGRCSFPLRDLSPSGLESMLLAAARQRLEVKARRLERLAALHGWDQAIFQELAAALGYRRNQWAMRMLAQRLPLRLLTTHPAGAEALLFGAGGFLETRTFEQAPNDARAYLRALWETWWRFRGEFSAVPPPRWVLAGSRPQNHPHRRLGALAEIVRHWKKIRPGFDPPAGPTNGPPGRVLAHALAALRHPHWDRHFTLASAPVADTLALVGQSRVHEVLANLVFPRLSLRPEAAAAAWSAYTALPATLENETSRRAAIRLLGKRPDAAVFQKKLVYQQALVQIYRDFCLVDDSDCARCRFPEQLARWPGVAGENDG